MPTTNDSLRLRAKAMSEKQLQKLVLEAAKTLNWKTAHFTQLQTPDGRWVTPVQGDGKGFPDCILANARLGCVMAVEFKSAAGKLTPEQEDWLFAFRAGGIPTRVWSPLDWLDGTIQKLLAGGPL
jgi:hypothetical protein